MYSYQSQSTAHTSTLGIHLSSKIFKNICIILKLLLYQTQRNHRVRVHDLLNYRSTGPIISTIWIGRIREWRSTYQYDIATRYRYVTHHVVPPRFARACYHFSLLHTHDNNEQPWFMVLLPHPRVVDAPTKQDKKNASLLLLLLFITGIYRYISATNIYKRTPFRTWTYMRT